LVAVFETYQDIVTQRCDGWNFFANDIESIKSITSREYAIAVKGQGRWYALKITVVASRQPAPVHAGFVSWCSHDLRARKRMSAVFGE